MVDQRTAQTTAEPASADGRRHLYWLLAPLGLLLRLIGTLLLLVLLLLAFVLGTQTGLRAAVAVAEDLVPDRVSVGAVRGRVLGELSIADLSLNLPGLALKLGRLHLDWRPGALLKGRLRVADLSASDIDIITEPSGEPPTDEPLELPDIRLPIEIDIDRVLVERLRVAQKGAPPEAAIVVTRAELSASAMADEVDLRRLAVVVAQPEAQANANGSARLSGDYPLNLTLDWRFRQAPSLLLKGKGQVGGSLAVLAIEHQITGVAEADLQVEVRDALNAPSWTADVRLEGVDLPAIAPDAPAVDLTAELHSTGDLERAEVEGSLRGAAPALAEGAQLDAELDLLWEAQRLTLNQVRLTEAASKAQVDLDGHLDLAGDSPAFEVHGAWERLRWPLTGAALAESPLGKLDFTGTLDTFAYSLSAEAFGEQVPETKLSLTGKGSGEQTEIESLLVETLGGRIEASGDAAWAPAVTWDVALTAADVDPGLQWSGLDGKVTLEAETSGGLDDGYRFDVKANAALSAYPPADLVLGGTGDLSQAKLDTLRIDALEGRVEGSGQFAWAPAVTWDLTLRADDLDPGAVQAGLGGRIGFELSSAGGLDEGYDLQLRGSAAIADYPPAVLDLAAGGDLESAEIERLEIQVLDGRIDGTGRVAWAPEVTWDAALTLADLDPGTLAADWPGRLGGRVESSGRLADDGPKLKAAIDQIRGELRGFPVRLDAEVDMAGETVRLRRLVAGSGTSEARADGELSGQTLSFRFDVDSPDLAALVPGGGGSLAAKGSVSGTLEAPRIQADLSARDAEVNGQGIAAAQRHPGRRAGRTRRLRHRHRRRRSRRRRSALRDPRSARHRQHAEPPAGGQAHRSDPGARPGPGGRSVRGRRLRRPARPAQPADCAVRHLVAAAPRGHRLRRRRREARPPVPGQWPGIRRLRLLRAARARALRGRPGRGAHRFRDHQSGVAGASGHARVLARQGSLPRRREPADR
jgi:autotransporter translocation and assembly factor TamB